MSANRYNPIWSLWCESTGRDVDAPVAQGEGAVFIGWAHRQADAYCEARGLRSIRDHIDYRAWLTERVRNGGPS